MFPCALRKLPVSRTWRKLLLLPEDRDTHVFFFRLQSNVFAAASLFQTNHVVHFILVVRRRAFFVLRDVHSQRVNLQKESLSRF